VRRASARAPRQAVGREGLNGIASRISYPAVPPSRSRSGRQTNAAHALDALFSEDPSANTGYGERTFASGGLGRGRSLPHRPPSNAHLGLRGYGDQGVLAQFVAGNVAGVDRLRGPSAVPRKPGPVALATFTPAAEQSPLPCRGSQAARKPRCPGKRRTCVSAKRTRPCQGSIRCSTHGRVRALRRASPPCARGRRGTRG
jgi:hypothetical protein